MHQRDEVAVLCRLGATNAYIRRPYLWFGALVGVAGGLLAAALLFAARTALRTPWQDIVAGVMLTPHALAETNAWLVALPALLGALLGWLGAAVATGVSWPEPSDNGIPVAPPSQAGGLTFNSV